MKKQLEIAALAAAVLSMDAAESHHSFSPVYDGTRMITVEGTVTGFRLVNPHATMSLEVIDDNGTVMKWTVEFDGRTNLSVYGWNDETIAVGERLLVTGNPSHTGSTRMFFMQLNRPDGTQLRRPIVDHFLGTVEQDRQQRIQEREKRTVAEGQ